jgi:hypothetical protein
LSGGDQLEQGFKWWVRYVIVPLLAGGGLVGIAVALITHSPSDHVDGGKPDVTQKLEGPPEPPSPGEVVDLSKIDTSYAPGLTVAAAPELLGYGITIEALVPSGSDLVVINNRALYNGTAVKPTWSRNFLTQLHTGDGPASFTLRFSRPLESLTFTRPALYAYTESGITHPAWVATAFDAGGRELSSHSEGLVRSLDRDKDVPARTVTLTAPDFEGIALVRFESDFRLQGKPFAAFGAILIERMILVAKER